MCIVNIIYDVLTFSYFQLMLRFCKINSYIKLIYCDIEDRSFKDIKVII